MFHPLKIEAKCLDGVSSEAKLNSRAGLFSPTFLLHERFRGKMAFFIQEDKNLAKNKQKPSISR